MVTAHCALRWQVVMVYSSRSDAEAKVFSSLTSKKACDCFWCTVENCTCGDNPLSTFIRGDFGVDQECPSDGEEGWETSSSEAGSSSSFDSSCISDTYYCTNWLEEVPELQDVLGLLDVGARFEPNMVCSRHSWPAPLSSLPAYALAPERRSACYVQFALSMMGTTMQCSLNTTPSCRCC